MSERFGIVIVNYNTFEETCACINSIKKHSNADFHIYIVENGSRQEIKNKIINNFCNDELTTIINLNSNLGYSAGNNKGIQKAIEDGVDYILIANSDIEFYNNVLEILKTSLTQNVVISGPKITNLDNVDGQQLIKTYSTFSALIDRVPFYYLKKYLGIKLLKADKYLTPISFFGMVQGSCFLIKSRTFQELEFFDDNVFLYSEERILSIKLKNRNWKVCYNPNAQILHKEGQSTKKEGNPFADYHRYASDYYTIGKYCKSGLWEKRLIRFLREFNFWLKSIKNNDYKPFFIKLKNKYDEIEKGIYKISSGI